MAEAAGRTWGARALALLVGTVVTLGVAEAGLRVAGVFFDRSGARTTGEITILAEGDSFTYGIGGLSFPSQLEALLDARFGADTFQAVNEGIPGLNTALLADRLDRHIRAYDPDIVVVLAGENNGWNSIRLTDPEGRASVWTRLDAALLHSRVYKFVKVAAIGWQHGTFSEAYGVGDDVERTALHMLEVSEEVGLAANNTRKDDPPKDAPQGRPERAELRELMEIGSYDACVERSGALIAAYPDDPYFYVDQAACLMRLGRHDEAVDRLNEAFEHGDPGDLGFAYHQLGAALEVLDRDEDAIAVWVDGLQRDPSSHDLFHAIAYLNELNGDLWKTFDDVAGIEGLADNPLYVYLERLRDRHGSAEVRELIFESMQADVRRIVATADDHGIPVIFVSYPNHGYPAMRRAAEDAGATYVDLQPVFAERFERREEYISADNCHCNTVGYRTIAEVLAPVVLRELGMDDEVAAR